MTRQDAYSCTLWLPFFCLAAIVWLAAPAGAEPLLGSRPNIVLVMTDDQGLGELSGYGHPVLKTPHLDRLREQSVTFADFHVSPTCAPTRAALLTGRHEFASGVTHTIHERERLTLDATTIAEVLRRAGYSTGIFGKWHLGDEAAYQPERRGFDEVFIHGAGGIGQDYGGSCADAPPNEERLYFGPVVRHNGTFKKTEGFCTDVFFEQASGWIRDRSKGDKPFFVYLATNAPHFPLLSRPEDKQPYLDKGWDEKTAACWGMIKNIDDNVGRLRERLTAWGLDNNTLFIFMADNGQAHRWGEKNGKGQKLFNAGLHAGKGSSYEGGTRAPAFWCWKDRLGEGAEVEALTAHIDLFRTFASLAGAEVPEEQVEGRDLLPLLEDPTAPWDDRKLFVQVGRWEPGDDPATVKHSAAAVRTERFRLVHNEELYDIDADPGETTNVIDRHPEVVAELRAAYEAWWERMMPLVQVNENPSPPSTPPYHQWYHEQAAAEGISDWTPPEL